MTDLDRILDAVASEYGQRRSELLATTRGPKETADARQVAMYLSSRLLPRSQSLSSLGRFFGRDRTTVRHARDKWAWLNDPRVQRLEKQLARTITTIRP